MKYTLKVNEREQGNGVEGMNKVGEESITCELSPDPTNYTHVDIRVDVDAIAAALGCEVGNFGMQALDDTDNWASRRTCEALGCVLESIVPVPEPYRIMCSGSTQKCRYIYFPFGR